MCLTARSNQRRSDPPPSRRKLNEKMPLITVTLRSRTMIVRSRTMTVRSRTMTVRSRTMTVRSRTMTVRSRTSGLPATCEIAPLSEPATAANRRSTRTEATRNALIFNTAAEREGCVVLEALCQHREATSQMSRQAGAPLSQRNWGSFSKNSGTAQGPVSWRPTTVK